MYSEFTAKSAQRLKVTGNGNDDSLSAFGGVCCGY